MTPFEMALAIRNDHDADRECIRDFALRTFPKETASTLETALTILIGWERAYDEFEELVRLLTQVKHKGANPSIAALIERRRQLGYDAKFEALLARQWRCPHCEVVATILQVEFPVGEASRMPRCVACGKEGIAPIDGEPRFEVRDGGKTGLRPLEEVS